MLFSNIDDGYLEGLLRGYRAGILTSTDYQNLSQCETIDGAPRAKLRNSRPCFRGRRRARAIALCGPAAAGPLVSSAPFPLCGLCSHRHALPFPHRHEDAPRLHRLRQLLAERALAHQHHHPCGEVHGAPRRRPLARALLPLPPSHPPFPRPPQEKLVEEFNFLKAQASEPLATFLDYVTYGYMIDNMTLVLLGRGKDRELSDLLEKCHPLGVFTEMKAIVNIEDAKELFHTVLVDTPLGQYFGECIDMDDIENDTNIEIIRNTLYKVTAAAAAQLTAAQLAAQFCALL